MGDLSSDYEQLSAIRMVKGYQGVQVFIRGIRGIHDDSDMFTE